MKDEDTQPQQGRTSQAVEGEAQGTPSHSTIDASKDSSVSLAEVEMIASRKVIEGLNDDRYAPDAPINARQVLITMDERDRLCAELRRRIEREQS